MTNFEKIENMKSWQTLFADWHIVTAVLSVAAVAVNTRGNSGLKARAEE